MRSPGKPEACGRGVPPVHLSLSRRVSGRWRYDGRVAGPRLPSLNGVLPLRRGRDHTLWLSELTLAPERWHLSYDGEFLSLNPSIGNSRLHCRSHYWIRRNKVVWCRPMTPVTSALAQKREDQERESKYDASGHAFSRLKKFFTKCWSRFR